MKTLVWSDILKYLYRRSRRWCLPVAPSGSIPPLLRNRSAFCQNLALNATILRFALTIGRTSKHMIKVKFLAWKIMSRKHFLAVCKYLCTVPRWITSGWLIEILSSKWKISKLKIGYISRSESDPMIIWPKEVSPTQGKMGRQSVPSTALSLRAMCLLQKRQNYEKWSTSCPDPIPCHRVPVWQEGGKQGSGLEWSQKEWI